MDTRAQSVGISRFLLSLVVGAFVVWIVQDISSPILGGAANATSNPQANQATVWFQDAVVWLPLGFLLIAFFGLLVLAIFQREVLR
jgi:hypothetical protein